MVKQSMLNRSNFIYDPLVIISNDEKIYNSSGNMHQKLGPTNLIQKMCVYVMVDEKN